MPKKPLYFEIFTTSLGALLLEISYTRIFSFKVFYYFTYLILGMGLLGLGAGGITVATSPSLRRARPEQVVWMSAFAGAATVLAGYFLIAPLSLDVAQHPADLTELGKLLGVSCALTSSFFAVGLVLSTILSHAPEAATTLYGLDLLGAALGCTVAVPLVSTLTPPRTVMLAGTFLALAGLRQARASRAGFAAGVLLTLALASSALLPGLLPDPRAAKSKQFEDFRKAGLVRFTAWSPVFRIDVVSHPLFPNDQLGIFHDGQVGSGMRRFSGDFKPFDYLLHDTRRLPFSVLPPEPRVLIIGAAGGHEVVSSLYFHARHVTGVELNPATYSLLTNRFADFTGHLAENPKVTLVNGDGRWFLSQSRDQYDLVWFVAPDSYAAMNAATSGAFVLSESYLYTVEMVKESLRHLSKDGVVCTQFGELDFERKPNRTTRYLTTARAAFAEENIADFDHHVLVATGAGFPPFREPAILLSKRALDGGQVDAFVRAAREVEGGTVVYVPGRPAGTSPPERAITLEPAALDRYMSAHAYQIDPVRDDVPFFWHFARFRDAVARALPEAGRVDQEDTIAEQVTLAFLALVITLAAAFLLVPLRGIRSTFGEMPHKLRAGTYFAALGLGFMFLEVALLQKLTLLLGYPMYSLSVTLASLLAFSGAGSLLSTRFGADRNRTLARALAGLAVFVLVARVGLPWLTAFVGKPLPVRIFMTVALIAPLGLCLGTFMPIGLRTVARLSPRSTEYVAWAWAVNGFFSVIASILATILAMIIGFRALLLVALAVYGVGVFALWRVPDLRSRDADGALR